MSELFDDHLRRYEFLVAHPAENLHTELKSWFNFKEAGGKAKVIRACFALRNSDGGSLLIGVDEETGRPSAGAPINVREAFPTDDIQKLLFDFASLPFEVTTNYFEKEHAPIVLIDVPSGISSPVITKKELANPEETKRPLVEANTLYCRTLHANGTYSSSKAMYKDFPIVLDLCWQNREMEIASFVKHHWTDLNKAIAALPMGRLKALDEFMDYSTDRFINALQEQNLDGIPKPGFFTVAFCWDRPQEDALPTPAFIQSVFVNAPDLTGWPLWLSPQRLGQTAPQVRNSRWEGLIAKTDQAVVGLRFAWLNFMVCDPRGFFFHRRGYFDDLLIGFRTKPPTWDVGQEMNMDLVLLETAEAIFGAKKITEGLFQNSTKPLPEIIHLCLAWDGLSGRRLVSESTATRFPWAGSTTLTERVTQTINLPTNAPVDVINEIVHAVTGKLFAEFGGYSMSLEDVKKTLDVGWKKVR